MKRGVAESGGSLKAAIDTERGNGAAAFKFCPLLLLLLLLRCLAAVLCSDLRSAEMRRTAAPIHGLARHDNSKSYVYI